MDEWRTPAFRQGVLAKITETVRLYTDKSTRNCSEIEKRVFQIARNKNEYVGMVAKLIVHLRGTRGITPAPGQVQGRPITAQNLTNEVNRISAINVGLQHGQVEAPQSVQLEGSQSVQLEGPQSVQLEGPRPVQIDDAQPGSSTASLHPLTSRSIHITSEISATLDPVMSAIEQLPTNAQIVAEMIDDIFLNDQEDSDTEVVVDHKEQNLDVVSSRASNIYVPVMHDDTLPNRKISGIQSIPGSSKTTNHITKSKQLKKRLGKSRRLKQRIAVMAKPAINMNRKTEELRRYHARKLELYEREVVANERIASALQVVAEKLTTLYDSALRFLNK